MFLKMQSTSLLKPYSSTITDGVRTLNIILLTFALIASFRPVPSTAIVASMATLQQSQGRMCFPHVVGILFALATFVFLANTCLSLYNLIMGAYLQQYRLNPLWYGTLLMNVFYLSTAIVLIQTLNSAEDPITHQICLRDEHVLQLRALLFAWLFFSLYANYHSFPMFFQRLLAQYLLRPLQWFALFQQQLNDRELHVL
jgi:hypothetical protein